MFQKGGRRKNVSGDQFKNKISLQKEKKLVKHAFKAKQSQYSNRCKETWN